MKRQFAVLALGIMIPLRISTAAVGDYREATASDCPAVLKAGKKLVKNQSTGLEVFGKFGSVWIARYKYIGKSGGVTFSKGFGVNSRGQVVRSSAINDVAYYVMQGATANLFMEEGLVHCQFDENAGD